MPEVIGGIVRGILGAVGGGLVTDGIISADQVNQISGAVVVLLTIVWSVIQKRMAAKKDE